VRETDDLLNQIEQITSQSEEKSEEIKKQKSRAASAHTTKGQILEKWCPFLEHPEIDPDWEAKNWSFMGNPIDYIIFDWRNDKTINMADGKVIMLDVKSGKSQLTTKQRRIRDLIQAGKVEWRTIRLE
jgi:predicted Holliday junction resolvase-like endonuclease